VRTAFWTRVSRAFGSGSRRGGRPEAGRPGAGRLWAVGLVVACLAVAGTGAALLAHRSPPTGSATYGGIPSWLPTPKVQVGRVVTASAAHPWLAIEGDTVLVHLARGQVQATAVGPAVPSEGQFPLPQTTICTFTVTLTRASGVVPLRASAFSILDELGRLHRPRVTAPGGGPLPATVTPGQTVVLTVRDRLPTGNGQLRWAPGTVKPIVSWDFDVEID
jgi:hypothetical protein